METPLKDKQETIKFKREKGERKCDYKTTKPY